MSTVQPRLIDLSHAITDGMVTYPGLPTPRMGTVLSREDSRSRYAEGTEFHIGSIELCTNTGTYLDTPFHRFEGGTDLAALDLARCAELPCVVVPATSRVIDADQFDFPFDGCAVLVNTGWDRTWGTSAYLGEDHPFLTEAAARELISGGAVLVGIDSLNIDSTLGRSRPAHTLLLGAGIPIVEHLTNLWAVPPDGAFFSAVPIRAVGLGSFPVRAFASVPARRGVCEVVFDVNDVRSEAAFWSIALGGSARIRSDDWATVRDPRAGGVLVAFQRVPEGKTTKNRVHLDVWSEDLADDTRRLEAAGATRLGPVVGDDLGPFQVMLDPEGNEFCLVS